MENIKALEKAGDDPKKRRKVQRKKPPERGYAHWDEQTFDKLRTGEPETLQSQFAVSHSLVLNVLDPSYFDFNEDLLAKMKAEKNKSSTNRDLQKNTSSAAELAKKALG